MKSRISKQYILQAIDELDGVLGVTNPIPPEAVVKHIRQGQIKSAIRVIALQLGLPVGVELSLAGDGATSGPSFVSSGLVSTNDEGRGESCITAQVGIPEVMPMYGSKELEGFPIAVRVSRDCASMPEVLAAVLSHELSHVLLHALWHPQKDNEVWTDLAALMGGLGHVMSAGRKVVRTESRGDAVVSRTQTYGYLDDEQFELALASVGALLAERKRLRSSLLSSIDALNRQCASGDRALVEFGCLLQDVDARAGRRFRRSDVPVLIRCHQIGHADALRDVVASARAIAVRVRGEHTRSPWYSKQTAASVSAGMDRVRNKLSEAQQSCRQFCEDLKVLRRYSSLSLRWRLWRERRKNG